MHKGEFKPSKNSDGKAKGWAVRMWHRESGEAAPLWAAAARQKGLSHLRRHAERLGLTDADAELELDSEMEDDHGMTSIAMQQIYKGVPVFSGSLLLMLDAGGRPLERGRPTDERTVHTGTSIDVVTPGEDKYVPGVFASIYADARRVETVPTLSPEQAVEAAERGLGYQGTFARTPKAELMILPHRIRNSGPEDAAGGASLVYRVELLVEDGTEATARWWYFIDAQDGHVAWRYDAMERGVGQSLYSGVVSFPSGLYYKYTFSYQCGYRREDNGYWTWDGSGQYGYMEAWDMNDQTYASPLAIGAGNFWRGDWNDSRWGMPTLLQPPANGYYDECDWQREQAGVEAMYDMSVAWDYFLTQHGWRGVDNKGYRMFSRVHYGNGNNANIAEWNGFSLTFGDGTLGRPWVSLDSLGHEWTHAIKDSTSKIFPSGESGAANESFGDIFGTMVEFLANNPSSPPDYLIGENFGNPVRNIADPTALGHPDHYNRRVYPGYCTPSPANDNCAVHSNAGIQNKAWYLMAVGGIHPYSRFSVAPIGRDNSADAFFKALTLFLVGHQNASLHAVRSATIDGCGLTHGNLSVTCDSVRQAWRAVGVPANMIDESWFFTRWHYSDFLNKAPDQGGWAFWADSNINRNCVPSDQACLDYWRAQVSRAFWNSGDFQARQDVRDSGLVNPPGSARPFDNSQFVRWCYKIYLRREPDADGWRFWTDDLNRHGDYNQTIKAFLFSDAYRTRFITMD